MSHPANRVPTAWLTVGDLLELLKDRVEDCEEVIKVVNAWHFQKLGWNLTTAKAALFTFSAALLATYVTPPIGREAELIRFVLGKQLPVAIILLVFLGLGAYIRSLTRKLRKIPLSHVDTLLLLSTLRAGVGDWVNLPEVERERRFRRLTHEVGDVTIQSYTDRLAVKVDTHERLQELLTMPSSSAS